MSKKKKHTGWGSVQRRVQTISHIIQTRITAVNDKHVCHLCGNDTNLMEVVYEAVTQDLVDQVQTELDPEATFDENMKRTRFSTAVDQIFHATLREQQITGPREHTRTYTCFACQAILLSKGTGQPHSGEVVLIRLLRSPVSHALFCARRVDDPEPLLLLNAPFQDPTQALDSLRHEQAIPRIEMRQLKK